jgi:hypothetical protein
MAAVSGWLPRAALTRNGLIRQVLGDRERGFDPDDAARPGSVEQAIAAY